MSSWFVRNLGDAALAGESLEQLRLSVIEAFERAGRPVALAAYTRHESEGRLHCELKVYFTPAASEVAKAVGAVACARPSRYDLGLLAGSEGAWEICEMESDG